MNVNRIIIILRIFVDFLDLIIEQRSNLRLQYLEQANYKLLNEQIVKIV